MSDQTPGERNTVALDAQWSAVARGYRNALILAAVLGVAAIGAGFAVHEPFIGPFICVGLVLGGYNARKLWGDTTALNRDTAASTGKLLDPRGAVMKSSLSRLGLITIFALLVSLVYRQDGWAVFVGLVIFQLVMMTLLIKPLRRVIAP
jgi:hypothetical protein